MGDWYSSRYCYMGKGLGVGMPIAVITCNCGSTEQLARRFLERVGYRDWMGIRIYKGKEKSRSVVNSLPHYPEIDMLNSYLDKASKWVVIIGWNENGCRWSDLTHSPTKSEVEARLVVETFAN